MNLSKKRIEGINFVIVGLAILIGLGLTVFGLLNQKWPNILPINRLGDAKSFVFFIGVTVLAIILLSRLMRWSISLIVVVLGILISFFVNGIGPLLAALLYGVASLSLGHIALQLLKISNDTVDYVQQILIGAGIYASLVSISAHFPINYTIVYYICLLIPIYYTRFWLLEQIRSLIIILSEPFSINIQDWPTVLLGSLGLLYFSFSFLPEVAHDPLAAHLFVPDQLAFKHIWEFNPILYVWALMPMLGDWNFAIIYLQAGETGARLINFGFMYLLLCLGKDFVLWVGGNKKGAVWGALLFISMGVIFLEGTSLFIEIIWSCYLLAALLWILRASSCNEERGSGIILAGIMLGFAFASKVITLIYLPVFLLPALTFLPNYLLQIRLLRLPIIKAISLLLLFGSMPYLVAYWKSGNPVFPFYNNIFQSSFYSLEKFQDLRWASGIHWDCFYQLVFASQKYIEGTLGSAGFQWVTLLIPSIILMLLIGNIRIVMLCTIGCCSLIILFYNQAYLRYGIPSFFILSMIIGVSIMLSSQVNRYLRICMIVIAIITLGLNLTFLSATSWGYRDIPVMMAFNQARRNQLLLGRAPIRRAIELVNILNDNHSPVAFISNTHGAGINADALYVGWYNSTFTSALNSAITPLALVNIFKKYRVNYILLDSNYYNVKQRNMIEDVTNIISSFSTISVRVLKNEYTSALVP